MEYTKYMDYIDISPVVSEKTAIFPGDTPFSRHVAMDFTKGDHLALSEITMSVHVGAHTDAPNHYTPQGVGIDSRPLDLYIGACQVVRVQPSHADGRIRVQDLSDEKTKIKTPRILFATGTFPDPNQWQNNFASLSPELIHWLAEKGVRLVGIDTPSIDPADSKALESHHAVAERDMAILEGVVLDHVKPGLYTLVALPLRLKDADASPVRAILLPANYITK